MKKIKQLEKEIIKHKNLYYQGKPEISDFEYDKIEEELRNLDPENEVLKIVGSMIFGSEKIPHDTKMLSLNKTYKLEELIKWQDAKPVISTFKIDGSSCSITYRNGKFELAKTRGDGKFGENITSKVIQIEHVPKTVQSLKNFEVRGEVYCTEENFLKLREKMSSEGLEVPSSQRNIVAGLLGRKEHIQFSSYLSFQAFELITTEAKIASEEEKFKTLIKLGFETPDYFVNKTKKDLEARLEEAKAFMSEGNYLIDGLVFTLNEIGLHEKLGETSHHPRYKIAFKFQGDTKVTRIKQISWQVSRNGVLTPVANVEPVELSGAKVARVTLHNFGMVKQFNLKKGDEIEIVRSGEVIPKFLEVKASSKNRFLYPEKCPSCDEPTFIEDIRLVCRNDLCPDKVRDEILNFIQKIGIEDLSSKRLEELLKLKLVTDIPSLYALTKEQLMLVDKVKDKLASKLIASIEASKSVDLTTFLASLGITGGAYNKCEKVVFAGFDTLEKIMQLKPSELMLVESFAEKSSIEFVKSLQSKKTIVKKLVSYGFNPEASIAKKSEGKIVGLKFCITGTLSMKRSELQKIVKKNGGIVQSSVSKETSYLITNDTESSSSKFKKAQSLEIPIISEEKFFNLLD